MNWFRKIIKGPAVSKAMTPRGPRVTDNTDRPPLEPHRGGYFQWRAPCGWRFSETMAGLSMYSPDRQEYVGVAVSMQSLGASTPEQHLLNILSQIPGYRDFRMGDVKELPARPSGMPGVPWIIHEIELSYTIEGRPVIGRWTVGVLNYFGYYNGSINGFSASVERWPIARLYLPEVAKSVLVINLSGLGGQDQVVRPRNNPLDNEALIQAFRNRGRSLDRISELTREGTMGYTLGKDAHSGKIWQVPLENYDAGAGGYRNPERPSELLVEVSPGALFPE